MTDSKDEDCGCGNKSQGDQINHQLAMYQIQQAENKRVEQYRQQQRKNNPHLIDYVNEAKNLAKGK